MVPAEQPITTDQQRLLHVPFFPGSATIHRRRHNTKNQSYHQTVLYPYNNLSSIVVRALIRCTMPSAVRLISASAKQRTGSKCALHASLFCLVVKVTSHALVPVVLSLISLCFFMFRFSLAK